MYVHHPKEAQTNSVWKLRKCVYGLADPSRYWYLNLREELIKLGAKVFSSGIKTNALVSWCVL